MGGVAQMRPKGPKGTRHRTPLTECMHHFSTIR
jgi:hypothetical protein